MKIIVNYDLIKKIKDVKEPFSGFKLIRTKGPRILKLIPFYFLINLALFNSVEQAIYCSLGLNVPLGILLEVMPYRIVGEDFDKLRAEKDLRKLSVQLQDLNLKTNYELLLESYEYEKKYSIHLDENKIPYILESKYIVVPTYDYNGDIKESYIVQEHALGDKEYVLTLGRPNQEFKFSYSNA